MTHKDLPRLLIPRSCSELRIGLRILDVGMTQPVLHKGEICVSIQKMRSNRVLEAVKVQGTKEKNQVVLLKTEQGWQITVDLGPSQKLQDIELTKGTQINVRGRPVRISNRIVLLANQVTTNGETVQIKRLQK